MSLNFEHILRNHVSVINVPAEGRDDHRVAIVRSFDKNHPGWLVRLIEGPSYIWNHDKQCWVFWADETIQRFGGYKYFVYGTMEEAYAAATEVPATARTTA